MSLPRLEGYAMFCDRANSLPWGVWIGMSLLEGGRFFFFFFLVWVMMVKPVYFFFLIMCRVL